MATLIARRVSLDWQAIVFVAGAAGLVGIAATRLPEISLGLTLGPILLALVARAVWRLAAARPNAAFLTSLLSWGLALRILMAMTHLAIAFIVYRGQVDFLGHLGLAREMLTERVLGGDFHPFDVEWIRSQYFLVSGFVVVILTAVMSFPVGFSAVGSLLIAAGLSLAGSYLFVRAFEEACPDPERQRFVARMIFLLPSLSFWSVFVGKDVLIFFALGWLTYAVADVLRRFRFVSMMSLLVSLALVYGLRPHIGLTTGLACAIALFLRPLRWNGPLAYLRPFHRMAIGGAVVALYLLVGSSALLDVGVQTATVEALAERAFVQHRGFAATAGGSSLPIVIDDPTPERVAAFIPLGVFTLLFRPGIWEPHNPLALAAGIENLFLLGLVLTRLRPLGRSLVAAARDQFTLFVLITFVTGAVVLCFEWNLGASQRHRTMILPYLLMLLAAPGPRAPAVSEGAVVRA